MREAAIAAFKPEPFYTAQQTLDYTQNFYEKKMVTYPRTDSRFLTDDMAHSLPDIVNLAFHTFPVEDVDNVPVHAEQVVSNKKVTDHHAIIPTRELQKCNLGELPRGELAILQLISNLSTLYYTGSFLN